MGTRSLIGWALLAALGLVACPGHCPAQQKLGPPGPPPSGPPVPVALGANGPPPSGPPVPVGPPPPAAPEPVLPPDAAACACPTWSGWYVGADVAVLWPSVDLHFTGDGRFDLNATASPRAWVGYQFEQGSSIRLAYRNLDSSGNLVLPLAGEGDLQTAHVNLDANWVDLDYVSRDYTWCGSGRFAWELGGRFTSWDLDARAEDFSGLFAVKTRYFGGGPHLGLDAAWLFGDDGWALFSRLDGALTFGDDRSRPQLQVAGPIPVDLSLPDRRRSETEADLVFQVGLSWTHAFHSSWVHVAGGLQVEGWGFRREDPPLFPARGVAAVGPFLGVEYGY
jgi:hypothetical protein